MDRKSWKRFVWGGLFLVLLAGTSGCDLLTYSTIPERQPETGKPMAASYRFEDIPIPAGMTLNRKESFIYETRATKTGLLVYEGKGEMEKLVLFFKQQMPGHKWKLMSNFELHNVMLTFVKEGWITVIYILPTDQEAKRVEVRVGPIDLMCQ
jgi:hypothetical protein